MANLKKAMMRLMAHFDGFQNNLNVEIIQKMQGWFEKGHKDLKVKIKVVNEKLSLQNKVTNDLNDAVNMLSSQLDDIKKEFETIKKEM